MMTVMILVCLALSFFFSGMETGVLLINRARIRHLKEHGSMGAGILLDFLHRPGHLSSTVLVGNTLVNTMATVLVAAWYLEWGGPLAAVSAVALFVLIVWFFGELLPKALFQRFPNRLATRLAPLLRLAYLGLWPLVQGFHFFSQLCIRVMGGKTSPRQMFVTRDELKLMAHEGTQSISLTGEQRNLVASILDRPHATARDIMKPKSEVVTVKPGQSKEERLALAAQSRFSRLPVETHDVEQGRWEGLWVVYDALFRAQVSMRPLPYFQANARLEEILAVFRKSKSPFAAVRDRQGKEIGIVTVEDVLRQYLGKIDL